VTIAAELQIPLAEAIRALRRELVEAVREGEDEEVRFALGDIDLELQVEVSKEAVARRGSLSGLSRSAERRAARRGRRTRSG